MLGLTCCSIALLFLGLLSAPVSASQLPPHVLVDLYLVRVERLSNEREYRAALDVMDTIISLQREHDSVVPEEFHFVYAQLALSAGLPEAAIESVNRYLTATGRAGEFYADALQLWDRAEAILEQEQRRAEEGEERRRRRGGARN